PGGEAAWTERGGAGVRSASVGTGLRLSRRRAGHRGDRVGRGGHARGGGVGEDVREGWCRRTANRGAGEDRGCDGEVSHRGGTGREGDGWNSDRRTGRR